MGAVCCCLTCFSVHDISAHGDGNHQSNGYCQCLHCSVWTFMNKCRAIFDRQSRVAAPTSNQGVISSNSITVHNSSSATNEPSHRYLPSNANFRYSLVPPEDETRVHKVSSHSRVDTEPLRNSGGEVIPKELRIENQIKLVDPCEKESRKCCPESSMSFLSSKVEHASGYYGFSSSEDEDVCPTCLEEYTPENPKIVTKCSHHYHLSCIYEWMERSETCPVCGRLMLFDETN